MEKCNILSKKRNLKKVYSIYCPHCSIEGRVEGVVGDLLQMVCEQCFTTFYADVDTLICSDRLLDGICADVGGTQERF